MTNIANTRLNQDSRILSKLVKSDSFFVVRLSKLFHISKPRTDLRIFYRKTISVNIVAYIIAITIQYSATQYPWGDLPNRTKSIHILNPLMSASRPHSHLERERFLFYYYQAVKSCKEQPPS